jgi:uncharacterized protein YkwD
VAACGGGGSDGTAQIAGPSTPVTPTAPVTDNKALQLQAPDLSGLSPQVAAAFSYINAARLRYGQGVLNPDPLLQKAAQDHANWIANADSIPEGAHYQVPGTPNFTGYSPADRVRNAGYTGSNSEVLSAISENAILRTPRELGEAFIKDQLNTVYHRISILGPWRDAGYGWAYYSKKQPGMVENAYVSSVHGLSLGCKSSCQYPNSPFIMVYPTPDSIADGLRFSNETPNPAPDLGIGAVFGFPITIETSSEITSVGSFELRGPDNQIVNSRVHSAKDDPARVIKSTEAFLLPLSSLIPNSTYTVKLQLQTKAGAVSKEWKFSTPATN